MAEFHGVQRFFKFDGREFVGSGEEIWIEECQVLDVCSVQWE